MNTLIFMRPERNGNEYHEGVHFYEVVEQVLKALGYEIGKETETSRPIIGVLWFSKTNKGKGFIEDALELCKDEGNGVDGLLIVTADDIEADEVPFRESPILCTGKERIQICKATLTDVSDKVMRLEKSFSEQYSVDAVFRQKLEQVVATYAVFQPIGVAAGHGARNDVTNRLFAPMRLLAKQKNPDWKNINETWLRCKIPKNGKSC